MRQHFHKFVAILCILMHFGIVFLAEFGHRHIVPGAANGIQTIAGHECSTVEHHLPIDGHPQCLLCSRFISIVFIAVPTPVFEVSNPELCVFDAWDRPVLRHFLTSISRRGPPLLFS